MTSFWEIYRNKKMIFPQEIEKKIASLRNQGKTIATLNGSFDLLHAGHLHLLFAASQQADVLIVALNSDSSIKQYKSPARPLITLDQRMQMMSALEFVDYVTWFDELDPRDILEKIQPDVHVNGSEYGKDCVEEEVVKKYGGKIHIVTLVPGLSSSSIIEKIKKSCD